MHSKEMIFILLILVALYRLLAFLQYFLEKMLLLQLKLEVGRHMDTWSH